MSPYTPNSIIFLVLELFHSNRQFLLKVKLERLINIQIYYMALPVMKAYYEKKIKPCQWSVIYKVTNI